MPTISTSPACSSTVPCADGTCRGKEALVEKFKNSIIMDEREAWRPKIFYSSGPHQGLEEPFPAPTHMKRKERGAHNRGQLYVGAHGPPRGLLHQGQPPREDAQDVYRAPFRRPVVNAA
jgi:hypothetical protein